MHAARYDPTGGGCAPSGRYSSRSGLESLNFSHAGPTDTSVAPSQTEDSPPGTAPLPVPKGAYAPAIIVLLTDGASNAGPLPADAAQQAADRGLRVYTIGFGTDDPGAQSPSCGLQFIGREPAGSPDSGGFGGGGFGGGGFGGGGGGGPGGDGSCDIAVPLGKRLGIYPHRFDLAHGQAGGLRAELLTR